MKYRGRTGEYFEILETLPESDISYHSEEDQLSMLWLLDDNNSIDIDARNYNFKKNQIIFLTAFNKVNIKSLGKHRYLKFNKPFYCILDHDSEVGCKGILFFGASEVPILNPNEQEIDILETVWKMLALEMESNDNLQLEMLQMMLKRILILATRIYKSEENYQTLDNQQENIVREFNFLVESHFKTKHSVSEYAQLLNKSPKTISNLFGKLSTRTPLQFIQDRIMLEVRRLLSYTDISISEVGYEVGFKDIQSFSRFFKKHQGVSPSEFRASS